MARELIAFLNFEFRQNLINVKSVSGDTLTEVPRFVINWREYQDVLAALGLKHEVQDRPVFRRYLSFLGGDELYSDLVSFQAELRSLLAEVARTGAVPAAVWKRIFKDTNGLPMFIEPEGEGEWTSETSGAIDFHYDFSADTYRLFILAMVRGLILNRRIFTLTVDGDGKFALPETWAEPGEPAPAPAPALSAEEKSRALSEAVAADLPAALAAAVADKLPIALAAAVVDRLEAATAEKLPAALADKVAQSLPEALAAAVEEKLPEALSEMAAEKLPEIMDPLVREQLPSALAEAVTAAMPEKLAEAVAEKLPNELSAAVNEALPEALHAAVNEALPEALSAAVNEALPEALSTAVSEALPEALSTAVEAALPEALALAAERRPEDASASPEPLDKAGTEEPEEIKPLESAPVEEPVPAQMGLMEPLPSASISISVPSSRILGHHDSIKVPSSLRPLENDFVFLEPEAVPAEELEPIAPAVFQPVGPEDLPELLGPAGDVPDIDPVEYAQSFEAHAVEEGLAMIDISGPAHEGGEGDGDGSMAEEARPVSSIPLPPEGLPEEGYLFMPAHSDDPPVEAAIIADAAGPEEFKAEAELETLSPIDADEAAHDDIFPAPEPAGAGEAAEEEPLVLSHRLPGPVPRAAEAELPLEAEQLLEEVVPIDDEGDSLDDEVLPLDEQLSAGPEPSAPAPAEEGDDEGWLPFMKVPSKKKRKVSLERRLATLDVRKKNRARDDKQETFDF